MGPFTEIISILIVSCFVIAILWWVLVRALLHWRAIMVEGYVIDRSRVRVKYGMSYYLKYTYSYKGKTYTHKVKVDEERYYIWSDGGKVTVRCFPAFAYISLLDV
jgi:hypothetical protein